MWQVLTIKEKKQVETTMKFVKQSVNRGLPGGPVEIRVQRVSKNRLQEGKYHALIADISKTVELEGKYYDQEIWKAWLVDDYENELLLNGEELLHPSKTVMSMDKKRAVTIRASTAKFLKREASGFIEYLYMTGFEYGAKFTDKSLSIYDDEIKRHG